jgi:excisionase family DNA binding protein
MDKDSYSDLINSFSQEFQRINKENAELWVRLVLAEKEIKNKHKSKPCAEGNPTDQVSINLMENKLIQKEEVAKRLNKSTKWVENYCKAGVIPFIKIGRSVFFNWEDVAESLEANSSVQFLRKY